MHTEVEFSLETKVASGKGAARKNRAAGRVPGVVYGPGLDAQMVTFREQDLVKALSTPAARNVFLRVRSPGSVLDGTRVIVKDLQVHPVERSFLHADFYKPDPTKVIHATVPVRLVGMAIGVKLGGILQVARRDLLVACLVDDLPEAIEVDVTELSPGHSIHVVDVVAPEGVRILAEPKLTICAVIGAGYQEEATEEAEGAAAG
ncbi:MAG: 50S ribosomal protein L25 [Deltaproteobacteria bacterium]|nr:50S ribosomal protein L25 [Deltaproteobacteria bacterium]